MHSGLEVVKEKKIEEGGNIVRLIIPAHDTL